MQVRTLLPFGVHIARKLFCITFNKWSLSLLLAMVVNSPTARAQQSNGADADKQTIQMLLQRIDKLESQVARLNAAVQQTYEHSRIQMRHRIRASNCALPVIIKLVFHEAQD